MSYLLYDLVLAKESNPGEEGALLFTWPPRVYIRKDQHILIPEEEGEEEGEHTHVLVRTAYYVLEYMQQHTTRSA